ncbi:protein ALP1-like [Colletes gigas]|uniref:protein ALP1-like n=1 Tax=Colletes gigas TaxID=935657 RepID=UPI001C9B9DE5|nr:protein ALP1-like [Colletes gigas]
MSSTEFEQLLNLIGPKIAAKDTNFREAIPAKVRLGVTLRFLATGDSYHSLMYLFNISKQTISKIIPKVCEALIDVLQDYIKMPQNEQEWNLVAKDFNTKWNFPNCVGAMDGKHISIQTPLNSGTEFFNYKGFFSIVLFAVVDANYNFIYCDVGCQGRISDGGVLKNTSFNSLLTDLKMKLPADCVLPGRTRKTPFVFVGDDAFPLNQSIMKPYPGVQAKYSKTRIFNYRLSRARRISENVFGILSSVFRVFRKPIMLQPNTATKVTLASVYLHNFLRKSGSKNIYNPPGTFDSECSETGNVIAAAWRAESQGSTLTNFTQIGRKSSAEAQEVREEFKEYFSSAEGAVPWQYEKS